MKKGSVFMIVGVMMLTGLFFFPLWNIELGAPQYPETLGINIHIDGLQDQNEFDIQNIDGLNHYIGMKTLPKPDDMWEFTHFPRIISGMIGLGVLIGFLGFLGKLSYKWFTGWFVLMSILGVLGMYDFNLWMTDYGTNLNPNAILKLQNLDGTPMSYKPPLLGHKKLLNFDAYSYPQMGAYFLFVGMGMTVVASYLGWKGQSKS